MQQDSIDMMKCGNFKEVDRNVFPYEGMKVSIEYVQELSQENH